MLAATLVFAISAIARACPIAATDVLPELPGRWQVTMLGGLDRTRPDTMRAESTIASDLGNCLLREQLHASTAGYEALVVWGTNGADSAIQRVFAHSQHGRFGVYQGRRRGASASLRQENLSSQPDSIVVDTYLLVADHDHFSITSKLSSDRGRSWTTLSRWEYVRARSSP